MLHENSEKRRQKEAEQQRSAELNQQETARLRVDRFLDIHNANMAEYTKPEEKKEKNLSAGTTPFNTVATQASTVSHQNKPKPKPTMLHQSLAASAKLEINLNKTQEQKTLQENAALQEKEALLDMTRGKREEEYYKHTYSDTEVMQYLTLVAKLRDYEDKKERMVKDQADKTKKKFMTFTWTDQTKKLNLVKQILKGLTLSQITLPIDKKERDIFMKNLDKDINQKERFKKDLGELFPGGPSQIAAYLEEMDGEDKKIRIVKGELHKLLTDSIKVPKEVRSPQKPKLKGTT